jgi:energy-coupling factor transporter ATP-binding protein EcfA2
MLAEIVRAGNLEALRDKIDAIRSQEESIDPMLGEQLLETTVEEELGKVDASGRSLLHIAVEYDHYDILEELLSHGADVSIRDKKDKTAADLAKDLDRDRHHTLLKTRGLWQLTVLQDFSVNLNKLTKLLRQAALASVGEKKEQVLFVGKTGSGKSTFLNYLVGARYDRSNRCIEPFAKLRSGEEVALVGHGFMSQTLFPQIVNNSAKSYDYCDLPGLGLHNSVEEIICSDLAPKMVLNNSSGVKSLCPIISFSDLQTSNGLLEFLKLASLIYKLVGGDSDILRKSVCFLVTKAPDNFCVSDFLKVFIRPLLGTSGSTNGLLSKMKMGKLRDEEIGGTKILEFLLENSERIFIPHIFDEGESALVFDRLIEGNTILKETDLNFDLISRKLDQFYPVVEWLIEKFLVRCSAIREELPKVRDSLFADLQTTCSMNSDFQEQIRRLQKAVADQDLDNPEVLVIDSKEKEIENIKQEITNLKIQRVRFIGRIENPGALKDQLKEFERNTPHRVWEEVFRSEPLFGFIPRYTSRRFVYKGEPFISFSLQNRAGGFSNLRANRNQGEFEVTFKSNLSRDSGARVCIYRARSSLPEYVERIEETKASIDSCQRQLLHISQKITSLEVKLEFLESIFLERKESLRHSMSRSSADSIQFHENLVKLASYSELMKSNKDNLHAKIFEVDCEIEQKRQEISLNKTFFCDLFEILKILKPDSSVCLDFLSKFESYFAEDFLVRSANPKMGCEQRYNLRKGERGGKEDCITSNSQPSQLSGRNSNAVSEESEALASSLR